MKSEFDSLYTIAEVAEILRLSKWTVYRLVERRELAHVKFGRRVLFTKRGIQEFIESCELKAQE